MNLVSGDHAKSAAKAGVVEELRTFLNSFPAKPMFLGLLAVWIGLFQFLGNSTFGYIDTASLFRWMYVSYNAPLSEDGHGNLIPFVVLGLFWWKRRELLAVPKATWAPALGILGFAALLHLLGYVIQQPRLCIVAFFLGVYSLMGLTWGRHLLQASFFPFVLFIFCIPVGSLAEAITFPMRMGVAMVSTVFCRDVLGIDVIRDGARLFNSERTFQYDVALPCSGIRSLISLFALTTIYSFIQFRSSWRRILIILLAFPLAFLGNVARITGVVMAGEAFGQQAGLKVHDYAGFVTFLLAMAVVIVVGRWLEEKPEPLASMGNEVRT